MRHLKEILKVLLVLLKYAIINKSMNFHSSKTFEALQCMFCIHKAKMSIGPQPIDTKMSIGTGEIERRGKS